MILCYWETKTWHQRQRLCRALVSTGDEVGECFGPKERGEPEVQGAVEEAEAPLEVVIVVVPSEVAARHSTSDKATAMTLHCATWLPLMRPTWLSILVPESSWDNSVPSCHSVSVRRA